MARVPGLARAARQLHTAARTVPPSSASRSGSTSATPPAKCSASSPSTTRPRCSPSRRSSPNVKLERMTARKQTMVALKGSYSGILMFTMLPGMLGLTGLAPIALPVGLVMGRSSLREEKRRQLAARQAQAKNAIRRYCDEVSSSWARTRATRCAGSSASCATTTALGRRARPVRSPRRRSPPPRLRNAPRPTGTALKDLDAELARLRQLAQRAEAVRRHEPPRPHPRQPLLMQSTSTAAPGTTSPLRARAARLDEPLRVAIAGRVKSGKSTLLNALVGERLAPTDAGECTRIVTWYRDGHTYRVMLHPRTGEPRQTPVHPRRRRDRGRPRRPATRGRRPARRHLAVAGAADGDADRHPRHRLALGTRVARGPGSCSPPDDEETPADAVLYLMRHLHANDLEFLQAFHDTEVSRPNPVNAIGVLSRADEIGVGRLDSMASARRIAARLATDPTSAGWCRPSSPWPGCSRRPQ